MDENVKKFKILRNFLIACFVIIVLGSARLQILEKNKYYRLAEENRIRQTKIPAPRGTIYDRSGIEIANTRPGFYVSVVQMIADDTTLALLLDFLDLDRTEVEDRLSMQKNPFMPVKIAHDISYAQLSVLEEHMDKLKGVQVSVEPLRNYPYSDLFCHVLGYVGEITRTEIERDSSYTLNDYIGRMGLEQYHEQTLRGINGIEFIDVDARGREVSTLQEKRPIPFCPGQDLHTTLDCALCESVAVFLEEYDKAACVCMDPWNGEILVLYSKPGFDPNIFIHGLRPHEWQVLNTAFDAPMYNRAIMSCYPPGSTFKPFVALAALDAHLIEPNKRFAPCTGKFRLGNRVFACWKKHGSLDLLGAMINSCDIYFYQLGRSIGIDTLWTRAVQFGFGQKTGIALPNEKAGCLPDRAWFEKYYGKNWTDGHLFNISIGQGDLLVTPLQLACAYSAIANRGSLPVPSLQKGTKPRLKRLAIEADALDFVHNALHGVITSGTGRMAALPTCPLCGKTGTVQNPHGEDHSLFVGYAPMDSAEIVVCVLIENAGHGGSVAAPVAGAILRAYFNLRGNGTHAEAPRH
jgi:penicillin-binding protein 2